MLADARPVLLDHHRDSSPPAAGGARRDCCWTSRTWTQAARGAQAHGHHRRRPRAPLSPRHAAYVIYTSGSTGPAQGCRRGPRRVRRRWSRASCGGSASTRSTRVLQFDSFSFDASVWEMCIALFGGGGTLVFAPEESRTAGQPLVDLLNGYASRGRAATRGRGRAAGGHPPARAPDAGRRPARRARRRWRRAGRRPVRMFNGYGPTEAVLGGHRERTADRRRDTADRHADGRAPRLRARPDTAARAGRGGRRAVRRRRPGPRLPRPARR